MSIQHQEQHPQQKSQESTILSQKEIAEQEVINSKGKGYPRYSLDGKENNIIITYYSPYFASELKEDWSGGIIVFKIENGQIRKIWESTDEILLSIPRIEVRDITGDGKSEILAFWSDGKTEILYIYSWTGDNFKLITPITSFVSPGNRKIISGPIFGSYDGGILAKDIDGNKLEEVIIIVEDPYGEGENYQRIYKWDIENKEYYLWKEKNIGQDFPVRAWDPEKQEYNFWSNDKQQYYFYKEKR